MQIQSVICTIAQVVNIPLQPTRKDNMSVTIIGQEEALRLIELTSPCHLLLTGPPGIGKTYIAQWHAENISNVITNPVNGSRADELMPGIEEALAPIIIDECHIM